MDTPSTSVGPGIGAFIAFFVLALVLWLLMRNMNGRMRRMAYREQQRVATLEAQEAAREAQQKPAAPAAPQKRKARQARQRDADPASGQDGTDDPTP
jgi:predicted lipid-binding transport protein (Tim44 family)